MKFDSIWKATRDGRQMVINRIAWISVVLIQIEKRFLQEKKKRKEIQFAVYYAHCSGSGENDARTKQNRQKNMMNTFRVKLLMTLYATTMQRCNKYILRAPLLAALSSVDVRHIDANGKMTLHLKSRTSTFSFNVWHRCGHLFKDLMKIYIKYEMLKLMMSMIIMLRLLHPHITHRVSYNLQHIVVSISSQLCTGAPQQQPSPHKKLLL